MKYLIVLTALFLSACTSPSTEKQSTAVEKHEEASKVWIGTWEREEWSNNGTLEIFSIKEDSIYFTLRAFSGAHDGGIEEAYAVVKNNKAYYTNTNLEYDNCKIEFTLQGDTLIKIVQIEGTCFTGLGVSYNGEYVNSKILEDRPEKEETLLSLGTFKNSEEDSLFQKLVEDDYSLFLNSTQLTSEAKDLDQFEATVTVAGVRGLFTFMENIIMIDSAGHIWAAVIDDKSVLYYTNSPDYASALPKTIDKWREGFRDYEVVYKSKP